MRLCLSLCVSLCVCVCVCVSSVFHFVCTDYVCVCVKEIVCVGGILLLPVVCTLCTLCVCTMCVCVCCMFVCVCCKCAFVWLCTGLYMIFFAIVMLQNCIEINFVFA